MKADFGSINEEAVVTSADGIDDESEAGSELDAHSSISDQQQVSSTEEQDSSGRRSHSPTLLSSCESTMLENDSDGSVGSEAGKWVDEQKIENYFSVSFNNGSDNWGPLTMLKKLINAYADIVSCFGCCSGSNYPYFRGTAKHVLRFA